MATSEPPAHDGPRQEPLLGTPPIAAGESRSSAPDHEPSHSAAPEPRIGTDSPAGTPQAAPDVKVPESRMVEDTPTPSPAEQAPPPATKAKPEKPPRETRGQAKARKRAEQLARDPHAAAKAAAKKRPSRGARHPAVVIGSAIFTILLFVTVGGGLVAWYGQLKYAAPGPLAAEKNVLIPRGQGARDIAELLERQGVIDNWLLFMVAQQLAHRGQPLQAGEYIFKPHVPLEAVLDAMAEGRVVQHQITIPEGLTTQQIVERLTNSELLTGTPRMPLEGTLLPETYRVVRGMSRDEVLKRMAADQQKLVRDLWASRSPDLPLRTPQDMVILASIVEKETGKPDERSKVAAVFINRLNRKMRLQSDPTIIYGIVGGKGVLGRPITRADIVNPTPYNTYAIDGLPPGPIGNPGRDSLAAVANPAKTKDLYFVADGTGGHVFAETLDQHNRNVARWREIEADARTKAQNAAPTSNTGVGTGDAPPAVPSTTPLPRAPSN
ncbi:endolytic transglycosylase MltG [Xanthobacter sp. DSM 24535]|uniref:endolytic transglycosylase MltG n=1 Tax=Roseixanthobacter psychrophilus TaxID=3119917 RepID=UPI0037271079